MLKHFRMWGARLSLQPIAQDLCANGSWGRSAELLTRPLRGTKLSYAECGAEFPQHICTFYKKHLGLHCTSGLTLSFSKKLCSTHKLQTLPILVNYTDTEELNVSFLLTEVIQVFQHVCSGQSSHVKPNMVCHRSLLKESVILSNLLPAQN